MVFTNRCLFSTLSLEGLRLDVHLGCSTEERKVPQSVRFEILIKFPTPPQGCQSDLLSETICYAEICDIVRKVCQKGEYQLIEKLAWEVFSTVREYLPPHLQLGLSTTKEKPPIPALRDGARFWIGEWDATVH